MARQIVDVKGLTGILPMTSNMIYKAVRNPVRPIPHKKYGKRLMFDVSKVYQWFDSLNGKDLNEINL